MTKAITTKYICDLCGAVQETDSDDKALLGWRTLSCSNVNWRSKAPDFTRHACDVECERGILAREAGATVKEEALDALLHDRATINIEELHRLRAEVTRLKTDVDAARTANVQLYYSEVRDAVVVGVHTAVGEVMKAIRLKLPRWTQ